MIAQLMQGSGVQGPSTHVETDAQARAWAAAQVNHPWDSLVVTDEDTQEVRDLYEVYED